MRRYQWGKSVSECRFLDAHAHLDQYADEVLDQVVKEIETHQILTISTAMDVPSFQRASHLAARCNLVVPTFGIHPWKAPQYVHQLPNLQEFIAASPMIGEVGLDWHWVEDPQDRAAQIPVLEHFLDAARRQDKPVNLHTKGAEEAVLGLLDKYEIRRAVAHWYSGPSSLLPDYFARNVYFTVGVELLHSPHIREIARRIPERLLLTETDNPGGWQWLTGQVGMPRLTIQVVEALATLRGASPPELTRTLFHNYCHLLHTTR
jgi:TatD DNase family protein